MYSTSTPFSEIKPVRFALTSFAAQKAKEKVVQEAKEAVLPSSGLHATTSDCSTRKANWVDIGTIIWWHQHRGSDREQGNTGIQYCSLVITNNVHEVVSLKTPVSHQKNITPQLETLRYPHQAFRSIESRR